MREEATCTRAHSIKSSCSPLLQKFPDDKVDFIWFTDEKVFTVSSLRNPQNDRLYVPGGIKKKQVAAGRLLRTRTTFSRSVTVSVCVSKVGFTDLIFVDPGVKVNGSYYGDVLLSQKLLPVMREVSESSLSFSRTAHRDTEPAILSDFWNRQRQRSFPQICGLRTAPT